MYDVVMGQRLGIILKSQGSIMCVLLKYQTIFIQNKYKRKMRTLCSNVKHVKQYKSIVPDAASFILSLKSQFLIKQTQSNLVFITS
jgi:hypothetical protein